MTINLSIEIRQGNKTKVIPRGNQDFKTRLFPKTYNINSLLGKYVEQSGYRLKTISELFDGGYVKNYWATVEALNQSIGGKSPKKNILKKEEKSVDIF
jgi:hypothetical protein